MSYHRPQQRNPHLSHNRRFPRHSTRHASRRTCQPRQRGASGILATKERRVNAPLVGIAGLLSVAPKPVAAGAKALVIHRRLTIAAVWPTLTAEPVTSAIALLVVFVVAVAAGGDV